MALRKKFLKYSLIYFNLFNFVHFCFTAEVSTVLLIVICYTIHTSQKFKTNLKKFKYYSITYFACLFHKLFCITFKESPSFKAGNFMRTNNLSLKFQIKKHWRKYFQGPYFAVCFIPRSKDFKIKDFNFLVDFTGRELF